MNTKKCIFFPRLLVTLTAMLALTLCMAGQADAAYSWNGEAETGLVKFWEKDEENHGVYGLKDANGSIVVPAIYLDIEYAGPGRLIVCRYGEYDPKIWQCPYLHGVVDYAGNVLYPYTESPIYYCKEIDTIAVPNDGCTVLLNRDLREYDRLSYQSVRYWGNGFFYCEDGADRSSYGGYEVFTRHGVYKAGKGFVLPMADRSVGCRSISVSSQSSASEKKLLFSVSGGDGMIALYNEDGVRVISGLSYIQSTEDCFMIAAKLKKPEYANDYALFDGRLKIDRVTGEPIYAYGLIDYYGNEILPFAYDTMKFEYSGVTFGMWDGGTEEQESYGFVGGNIPTYLTYTYDTRVLGLRELRGWLPELADVSRDAWYYDAVQWAADRDMIDGTAQRLGPDDDAPRGEVIEYMWRAAGCPASSVANPFTDISVGDCRYEAVLWAYEKGITGGTTDTTFSPDATCTRAQVVTFLWRAMNGGRTGAASSFSDVSDDAYYASPVAWAVRRGITSGTTATTFSPNTTCTRAQILTFLYSAYNK